MIIHKPKSIKAKNILYVAGFAAIASLAQGDDKDPSFLNIPAPIVTREPAKSAPSPQASSESAKEESQETDVPNTSEEKKSKGRFQEMKESMQSKFQQTKKDIQKKVDNSETAQRALKTGKNVIKGVKQSSIGKKLGLDTRDCEKKAKDLKAKGIEAYTESTRLQGLEESAQTKGETLLTSKEFEACFNKKDGKLRLTPSCLIKDKKLEQYGKEYENYRKKRKAKSKLGSELTQQADEMEKNCQKDEDISAKMNG